MRDLVKNTLTNYLVVVVRLLQGILVTRWSYECLGQANYGLWSLLWSIFAYALLLDFGFGISAQKYTSHELYRKDINHYNSIISTVFSFHLCVSVLILLGSFGASFFLSTIFSVTDPERLAYCRICFFIFALGTAIAFPTGIFPEILVGLQKLYLRNYINSAFKLIELVATLLIFWCGGRLISIIVLAVLMWLLPNSLMWWFIHRTIPGFHISLRVSWKTCREIADFSGFVYINSLAKLVLNKSSRLIISIFCGLGAVGAFHISSRLADICFLAASQYQENVRPMTAQLYAQRRMDELRKFIVDSMRWNCFIGLLLMLPAYMEVDYAVPLLFNAGTPEVLSLSRWFVISMFVSLTVRMIPYSYLLMAEHHRLLAATMLVNAGLNIVLNILLLPRIGLRAVLWNSIGINLLLAGCVMIPVMLTALRLSFWELVTRVYLVPGLCAIPGALLAWGFNRACGGGIPRLFTAAGGGAISAGVFALFAWFFVLGPQGRLRILDGLHRVLNIRRAPDRNRR